MPVGSVGSSVVTPSQLPGQQPTIVQRSLISIRKLFFTAKDLTDPERLYQVITQQQQAYTSALQALGSSPLSVGILQKGVTFAAPIFTNYLAHGLGRPYQGYVVTAAYSNAWNGFLVPLPPNVGPERILPLKCPATGVFDIWVF